MEYSGLLQQVMEIGDRGRPCTCRVHIHRYVHYLSNKATLDPFYSLFLKGPMDFTIGFVSVDMELSFDNMFQNIRMVMGVGVARKRASYSPKWS